MRQKPRHWRTEAAHVGREGTDHVVFELEPGPTPKCWVTSAPLPLAERENKGPLCPASLLLNYMSERANEIPF